MSPTLPPELGQSVEVRRRQWVVSDVAASQVETDPLQPTRNGPQHSVKLSSVEEDSVGEELEVIWELEPGARVHEKALMPTPDGFDHPERLEAFLNAVRWGAIESADTKTLQSPFRSGITIEEYQLDPVARAIQMPRVNLLIADDVGLGKTIEAGLVAQELILRHRARTILIVCPASLQIQWRDQMRDKFGFPFRIVDSTFMRELRRRRGIRANPWDFKYLITSIDYLKRERPMRLFRELLPAPGEPIYPRRFDLLILDEAHNVAPAAVGNYATDSQRTLAIRTLAPHFEHKLFLTATPHNGYKESFSALLELLDDQRFARGVEPDPKQLEAVMVRRMKTEIVDWDGKQKFPERKLEAIEVPWTAAEKQAHDKLQRYGGLRIEAASGDETRGMATSFILKLLKKRMFSSPAAFLATLEEHEKTLRGLRAKDQRQRRRISTSILRREFALVEEDQADDERYEDATSEVVRTASTLFDRMQDDDRALLRDLKDWGRQASAKADSKAKKLLTWLDETLRPDGEWNDERVIVFTEYRATQKWLHDLFAKHGLASGQRLMTLYGGMHLDEREKIKAAFQAKPSESSVRILLATDAASEGIDLQNWCHRVIHYEIPWNPNKLEQRNGRVDRHGQRHQPLVYHFVDEGWQGIEANPKRPGDLAGDLEFLVRAAFKVDQIREDLGKVGPVIESQVEQAMLGHLATMDTTKAEYDAEAIRRRLRFEQKIRDRIAELRERLQDSIRELHVSPETIQAVVEIGLELAGQPALIEAEVPGIWPDPKNERQRCPVFTLPALRGSWGQCAEGIHHPHTGKPRPIVFENKLAAGRDDVVMVHLNHRLVQMCQRLLRAEVWAGDGRKLDRVSAQVVPGHALEAPAVVAWGRLLVLGSGDRGLHEQIVSAGGLIREGRFSRLNVGQTEEVLAAATGIDAPDSFKLRLRELWPDIEGSVLRALEARVEGRTKSLRKLLRDKARKEAADFRVVLEELAETIEEELAVEVPPLLRGWKPEEIRQLERNRESLEQRLAQIPGEIERETEAIMARYENPEPRLFPVALEFFVPERLVR